MTLTVSPSSLTVDAGDDVTIIIELRNDRSEPLVYAGSPCNAGSLSVTVPLPLEPAGRTWSGVEGWFKDYALANGQAAGIVPATQPLLQSIPASGCGESPGFEQTLAPGASVSSSFTWHAEIVGGLDALVGTVDFVASAGFDRLNGPPSYEPGYTGPGISWIPMFRQIQVAGQLLVTGGRQAPISIGQAIDGLLADATFSTWLRAQPAGTCGTVNVLPISFQGQSIFEPGPNWEIDLFCETGVPRHWAIAGVDPITADVRSLTFCDVPCGR